MFYRIQVALKHGPYEWTVLRRGSEFRKIDDMLLTGSMRQRFYSFGAAVEETLPKFPNCPSDSKMVNDEYAQQRAKEYDDYLNKVVECVSIFFFPGVICLIYFPFCGVSA